MFGKSLLIATAILATSVMASATTTEEVILQMGKPDGLIGKFVLLSTEQNRDCFKTIELKIEFANNGNAEGIHYLTIYPEGKPSGNRMRIDNERMIRDGNNAYSVGILNNYKYESSGRMVFNSFKESFLFLGAIGNSQLVQLDGKGEDEVLKIVNTSKQQMHEEQSIECTYKREPIAK